MPVPGDSCAGCFYSVVAPDDAGMSYAGKRTCNFNAPSTASSGGTWPWSIVADDWWCGQGLSADGSHAFNDTSSVAQPVAAQAATSAATEVQATQ